MRCVRQILILRPAVIAALVVVSFTPPAGAADRVLAGVEVGGKGAKLLVLRVPADGPAERLFAKTLDPTPLADLDPNGAFSHTGVRRTVDAVAELVALAREKYGVSDADLTVVGSSSLATVSNNAVIADAVRTRTGLRMPFLTAADEAILVFRGLVPLTDRHTAMALDIGSGNTRVAAAGRSPGVGEWYVHGTLPLGTVTLTTRTERERLAAVTAVERALSPTVREFAQAHPTLTYHRPKCYLTGGAVWAMVTLVKPDAVRDPVVRLTVTDIEAFAALVDKADRFPAIDLSGIPDGAVRSAADAEVARVRDTFTPGDLRSAAALLHAFARVYRFEEKDLVFRRDGQFAWILAHINPEPAQGAETVPCSGTSNSRCFLRRR